MWSLKLGDEMIFIWNVLFQIFLIYISFKNKTHDIPLNFAINEAQTELMTQEETKDYSEVELSPELMVYNQIEQLNWAWNYL